MIWPVAQAFYFLIGGMISMRIAATHVDRTEFRPFDLVTAFVVTFGVITLWPLLLALAVAEGANRER